MILIDLLFAETSHSNAPRVTIIKLWMIGLIQMAVGFSAVVISSFVNAEMTFAGWNPSDISIFLGVGIYFEATRIVFARLSDKANKVKPFMVAGTVLGLIGLLLIPYAISPPRNYKILIAMIFYSIGSSAVSTLIDAHVTTISLPEERNRIAGVIQGLRLLGFASGGILGGRLYPVLEFQSFIFVVICIFAILSIVSLGYISDEDRLIKTQVKSLQINRELILRKPNLLMLVFLVIYPLGLFMQDNLLEPYAILVLGFNDTQIGQLTMVWGVTTLIFVPIGVLTSNKIGKVPSLIIGQMIAVVGLFLYILSGNFQNIQILYAGLVIFGAGSGMYSVPGISIMFDVAALSKQEVSTILAIFGLTVTFSRASASILAGFILGRTGNSFETVFLLEIVLSLLSLIPIVALGRMEELKQ